MMSLLTFIQKIKSLMISNQLSDYGSANSFITNHELLGYALSRRKQLNKVAL